MTNTFKPLNYSEWKGWEESDFCKFSKYQGNYFDAEILPYVRGNECILEIGYGNGVFFGWCLSKKLKIIGVEVIPELMRRAHKVGIPSYESIYSEDLSHLVSAIDLVVAFDVMEHIPDSELSLFFKRVEFLLSPGGKFIFRVPNGDSPFALPFQNGDLTHKSSIGKNKIEQLATETGLDVIKTKPPAKSATKIVSLGRLLFEKIIAYLYFEGIHRNLSPNIVTVLSKKIN